jgi:hypothetical protein
MVLQYFSCNLCGFYCVFLFLLLLYSHVSVKRVALAVFAHFLAAKSALFFFWLLFFLQRKVRSAQFAPRMISPA